MLFSPFYTVLYLPFKKKNTRRVSSAYLGINDYVFKIKIIKEQKLIMKEVLIKLISLKFNIWAYKMLQLRKWKNREYNHIFRKDQCNKKMGKWLKMFFKKGIKIKPKYTKRY